MGATAVAGRGKEKAEEKEGREVEERVSRREVKGKEMSPQQLRLTGGIPTRVGIRIVDTEDEERGEEARKEGLIENREGDYCAALGQGEEKKRVRWRRCSKNNDH